MKKTLFLAVLAAILCVVFILPTSAVTPSDDEAWKSKIDDQTLALMETAADGELISVYIWLSQAPYDQGILESMREQGYEPLHYEDSRYFDAEIRPKVINKLYEDGTLTEDTPQAEYDTIVNNALGEAKREYSSARLATVKRVTTELNSAFVEKHGIEQDSIRYFSNYTSTLIVDSTASQIEAFAKDELVNDISYNEDAILVPDENLSGDGDTTVDGDITDIITYGDLNNDGAVDNNDAVLILKYDAGLIELDGTSIYAGDANGDDSVDNIDAVLVLRYDAGIIDSF